MAVLPLRHPVPARIIGVAPMIAVVEGRRLVLRERRAEPQTLRQVDIGNTGRGEGYQIRRRHVLDATVGRVVQHKYFGYAAAPDAGWFSIVSSRKDRAACSRAACHSAREIALIGASATEAPHRITSASTLRSIARLCFRWTYSRPRMRPLATCLGSRRAYRPQKDTSFHGAT